jgi:hypothetical protein
MRRTDGDLRRVGGRARPLVWLKQIVLYETIEPIVEIRRVEFTTGLNIIQGEANGSDGAFESGHGIGKTTVCRLVRYCLGEKSFGQKHVVEEIKHCFPKAYVGAVIEVDGIEWAILRPLGHRGKECALQGVDLNGLIRSVTANPFDAFTERLNAAVLSEVPVTESLSSGQVLQWLHVLAMCSRDQESRYDRFWNWRHLRSESGAPKFIKPKIDAGLCVRAIIGLLDPEEPRLRAKVEQLDATLEHTRSEIKEKRAEPRFHITRLRSSLAADCGVENAHDSPLDENNLWGIQAATKKRLEALRLEVAQVEKQLAPLDRQINLAAASLLEPAELADQLEAASEVTGEGNDALLADIELLRSVRQVIRDAESALCRYGGLLIGQCSYVQARMEQMDNDMREQQRTTLPTVSEREQVVARLAEQADRQRAAVRQIRERLDDLNRQKNDLLDRRRRMNDRIRRIPSMLGEIQEWNAILEGTKPSSAIRTLENAVTSTEAEIEATKTRLAELIASQAERATLVGERFDAIVRQTLTSDFRGVVEVEEEGFNFCIMRIESLSGEAYETLAVLLADIALLLESNAAHVHHPGILLHDSPREADLNLLIYQRLLEMADAQMREAGHNGDIPYQYIVTTTTLPSQQLQHKPVTKLNLSSGVGSLFKRQLEAAKPSTAEQSLFDSTEDK